MRKVKNILALLGTFAVGFALVGCNKTNATVTNKQEKTKTQVATTNKVDKTTKVEKTTKKAETTTEKATTKAPDVIEEGINITNVLALEVKDMANNSFEESSGIFSISGGEFKNQAVSLGDEGYMFTKIQVKELVSRYSFGQKENFPELERNSHCYLRFEAYGDGGIQIYVVSESGNLVEVLEPIMLNEESTKYQIAIPSALSNSTVGLVFKNPAPADTGTQATIKSVALADEIDPKNQLEFYTDVMAWEKAQFNGEDGFDPFVISASFGWSGIKGVSRADINGNYAAYIDGFGAALEYGNIDKDKDETGLNLEFEGVQIYGKFLVPEGTKKLTYWVGHVNDPSAYRIQLFYNGEFVNLTESSDQVNADNVKLNEGWKLTTQAYNGPKTFEVAIPSEYVGKEVIIIFSAKYNGATSYGIRVNNIAFSSEDVIIPSTVVEGINIDTISALDPINSGVIEFNESANGFVSLNNASYDAGLKLTGGEKLEGSEANGIVAAKVTLGSFDYLRVYLASETGKIVYARVRAVDFGEKEVTSLSDWVKVSGECVLQMQAFPSTFVGNVGLVIEYKYQEQSTLTISKVEFASANRDADGYDLQAINYVPEVVFPENGSFSFDEAGFALWNVFTANTDSNTKGMLNTIWAQLQSTNNDGAYSALIATKTKVLESDKVTIKAGVIGDSTLTASIRLRAILSDGTFVNFTKDGVTDADGWFNANAGAADEGSEWPWGSFRTFELDFNSQVKNQVVILVIEYDKETSTSWNALIENLTFVNPKSEKAVVYPEGKDADGYDYKTISELDPTTAPEDGYFGFDATEVAKWTTFKANDQENTKGMQNGILYQLQATDTTGAFSVLIARCVTLGNYAHVDVKSAIIGSVGDSAYLRVRAMLDDNSIVTFTKNGVTDANGWFNAMTAAATSAYGWGPVDTVRIDVPKAVRGKTVKLIVEYDKEPSSNWNVLLESLSFIKVIEYAEGVDADGYDYKTISELQVTEAPENGYYAFDATEVAKWTTLKANNQENTKGMQNGTLYQLQATDTTGAYSVLIARCVTLSDDTALAVKSAIIGTVGDSAYLRVRAMLEDNSIVTFTKEGVTDSNGWFNAMTEAATNAYSWGPVDTVTLDVPESVQGQTVKLIIEYDKEPSSNWNVLLESLQFSK